MAWRRQLACAWAALASVACSPSCPRADTSDDGYKQAEQVPPDECAERVANDVCGWSLARHLQHRENLRQVQRESDAMQRRGEGRIDIVEELRCGCLVQAFGPCFYMTRTARSGWYMIATGGPQCESDSFAGEARTRGVDPSQCGSIGLRR